MTYWIHNASSLTTTELLGQVILNTKNGTHVQLLTKPREAVRVVQRVRSQLSRSRGRLRARSRKVEEFTLRHSIYDYTDLEGVRHECLVMWTEKCLHHIAREKIDDLMDRE